MPDRGFTIERVIKRGTGVVKKYNFLWDQNALTSAQPSRILNHLFYMNYLTNTTLMKKSTMIVVLLLVGIVSYGQGIRKNAKLKEAEVPAAVRASFERDFGSIPEDGTWTVFFTVGDKTGAASATPLWYTYTNKVASEKVEVRYLPDGRLKSSKGIARKGVNKELEREEESKAPARRK